MTRRPGAPAKTVFAWSSISIPGLVHTMTPGGELEFVNQRNLDYFGKTLEESKGWASSDVFHPDDLPRAIDSWNRTH